MQAEMSNLPIGMELRGTSTVSQLFEMDSGVAGFTGPGNINLQFESVR